MCLTSSENSVLLLAQLFMSAFVNLERANKAQKYQLFSSFLVEFMGEKYTESSISHSSDFNASSLYIHALTVEKEGGASSATHFFCFITCKTDK